MEAKKIKMDNRCPFLLNTAYKACNGSGRVLVGRLYELVSRKPNHDKYLCMGHSTFSDALIQLTKAGLVQPDNEKGTGIHIANHGRRAGSDTYVSVTDLGRDILTLGEDGMAGRTYDEYGKLIRAI